MIEGLTNTHSARTSRKGYWAVISTSSSAAHTAARLPSKRIFIPWMYNKFRLILVSPELMTVVEIERIYV